MYEDMFTDRILETENLTDNLEDPEANMLLDWGIQRLPALIKDIQDMELAGDKVNALMAFMRKINRILGAYQDKSLEDLAADLASLTELSTNAFGLSPSIIPDTLQSTAESLVQMEVKQALSFLLEWAISSPDTRNSEPSITDPDSTDPINPDTSTPILP